jgi:hypothetical protein
MITYLKHERIDPNRWDECIAAAPNGNVYAWSWYLDLVHPGWDALVEIDSDKYLTVMPITKKKKVWHQLPLPTLFRPTNWAYFRSAADQRTYPGLPSSHP